MSIRPNAFRQASTMALTSPPLVTSHSCDLITPLNSATRSSVSFIASLLLSTAKTLAPSRANITAVARPLPQPGPMQPAPVTSAILPCRRPDIDLLRALQSELFDQRAPFHLLGLDVVPSAVDRRRIDGIKPMLAAFCFMSGSLMIFFISACSRSTIVLRRLCRREQNVPGHRLEIRRAGGLGERRHVGQQRQRDSMTTPRAPAACHP